MPLFSHWQKCKLHQLCFNHLPERHRPQVFTDRTWNSSPSQPWLNPRLFSCTRPKSVLLSWALDFLHGLKQLVYFSHHCYAIPTRSLYCRILRIFPKHVFQFWLYLKLWMLPDVLRSIDTTKCLLSCTDNFSKVIEDYRSLKGTVFYWEVPLTERSRSALLYLYMYGK